jgi:hypothetical protein
MTKRRSQKTFLEIVRILTLKPKLSDFLLDLEPSLAHQGSAKIAQLWLKFEIRVIFFFAAQTVG